MSDVSLGMAADALIAKGDRGRKSLSASEEAQYVIYLRTKNEIAAKITGRIEPTINQISILEQKQEAKTITADELSTLNSLYTTKQALLDDISSVTMASAKEAQEARDRIMSDQLAKISPPTSNGLSAVIPANLVEFLVRTQAINPYSRERECDIRFIKMLDLVATDSQDTNLKELKDYIQQKLKEYANG